MNNLNRFFAILAIGFVMFVAANIFGANTMFAMAAVGFVMFVASNILRNVTGRVSVNLSLHQRALEEMPEFLARGAEPEWAADEKARREFFETVEATVSAVSSEDGELPTSPMAVAGMRRVELATAAAMENLGGNQDRQRSAAAWAITELMRNGGPDFFDRYAPKCASTESSAQPDAEPPKS